MQKSRASRFITRMIFEMNPSTLFKSEDTAWLVPELFRRAAVHYERCGMWQNAAECWADAGQKDRAAELCIRHKDHIRAAAMLLASGLFAEALDRYRYWLSSLSEEDTDGRVSAVFGISACLRQMKPRSREGLAAYDEARRITEDEKGRDPLIAGRCWEALGNYGIAMNRIDLIQLGYEMALRRYGDAHNSERLRAVRAYLPAVRPNRLLTADLNARIAEWTPLRTADEKGPDVRYPRRELPVTASDENFRTIFKLNKRQTPLEYVTNEFKENGDGTITDHSAGLMWQKSGSDERFGEYGEAEAYVGQLNHNCFAGYDDWRLPTIDELISLLEPARQSNMLHIRPIFDENQRQCWSSDRRENGGMWHVHFQSGAIHWPAIGLSVRAVRTSYPESAPDPASGDKEKDESYHIKT